MCSLLPGGEGSLFSEGRLSLLPEGTVSEVLLKARKPRRNRRLIFDSIFDIDLSSLIYFWNKEKRLDRVKKIWKRREEGKKRITDEDKGKQKKRVRPFARGRHAREEGTDSLASYLGRNEVLEPSTWKERGQSSRNLIYTHGHVYMCTI